MSDWIEVDGKKYYEESYLQVANNNSKRATERAGRAEQAESHLASATDLANSWARETSVAEARDGSGLRDLIDRLWGSLSQRYFEMRDRAKRAEAETARLRQEHEEVLGRVMDQFGTRIQEREADLATARRQLAEAATERDELQASADLRWKADMRAIHRWQSATGKDLVWPDHADLCVWLMGQLAEARSHIAAQDKRIEGQQADTRRMDKAEELRSFEVYPVRESECAGDRIYICGPQGQEWGGKKVRDAFDAAIAAGKEQTSE